MSVGTLVPLSEYLSTAYEPDVEYVDGVLVERNVGDWLHSLIQSNIIFALRRKYPHLFVIPELRSKTAEARFRLPDVSVLLAAPESRFLLDAAYIAVEVLSEDDRMTKVMGKLGEYEAKGLQHIWVIDPEARGLLVYASGVLRTVDSFSTSEGVALTREEVFERC